MRNFDTRLDPLVTSKATMRPLIRERATGSPGRSRVRCQVSGVRAQERLVGDEAESGERPQQ